MSMTAPTPPASPAAVDWLQVAREHERFALNGQWIGVQTPHYALSGMFKALGDEIESLRAALAALAAPPTPRGEEEAPLAMTREEIRLEDLKQQALYAGPIVSFEVNEPYYLASCDHCGWVGSSEHCGGDSWGDDSDVYCPRCSTSGADCGKVAERIAATPRAEIGDDAPFSARELLAAMLLEHDAGGITLARLGDVRRFLAATPDAASVTPDAGETYRHKKRGTLYEMIGTAELQASHPQFEHAELAIYRGEDGKLWARNTGEFHDGRFERTVTETVKVAAASHAENAK
jgi:hypothetical protein